MTRTAHDAEATLVYGIVGTPANLDPHDQVLPTDYAVRLTYDSLLVPGEGEELECRLAESYRPIAADVWEFRLRDGLRFASGRSVTAEAVKWNFARLAGNRQFAPSPRLQTYADAAIVDERTIRFHTRSPDMAFPRRAVQVLIADPAEADSSGNFAPDAKAGTGLYRVAEYLPGVRVRFERSDTSWRGRVPIGAQELRPYDAAGMEEAFLRGEVHLGYVSEAGTERLIKAGLVCQRRLQPNIHTLRFRSLDGPFADRRLRRALALAVDQESIIRKIYRGHGRVPNQIVGPDCYGYDPGMPPFETDPDEARRLVETAGFTGTLHIDVLESSALLRPQGETIARQLTAVGLRTEVNYVDLQVYLAKMTRNNPRRSDLIGAGNQYGPGFDADFALDKFSNQLPDWAVEYSNAGYQAVYERSLSEPDIDRRRSLLQRCARMLIEDHACVPVWQAGIPWMVSPRVMGLNMNHCGAGWIDWLRITMER